MISSKFDKEEKAIYNPRPDSFTSILLLAPHAKLTQNGLSCPCYNITSSIVI